MRTQRARLVAPDQSQFFHTQCFSGKAMASARISRVVGAPPTRSGTVTHGRHSAARTAKRRSCAARGCGDFSESIQRGIYRCPAGSSASSLSGFGDATLPPSPASFSSSLSFALSSEKLLSSTKGGETSIAAWGASKLCVFTCVTKRSLP